MLSHHHTVPCRGAQIGPSKKSAIATICQIGADRASALWRRPQAGRAWGVAGLLGLLSLLNFLGLGGPSILWGQAVEQRFERRERHMGTQFVITAYAAEADRVERAWAAAFARIAALDRALSNYRSDSELMQLSHGAPHQDWVPVSDDLWNVLRAADRVSRASQGAFDVTVGPYAKLWRRARRDGQLPDRQRLESARASVGYQHIAYHSATQSVRLTRPATLLDLGGIAKGYALDQALAQMYRHGVTRVLIDGGGDILAGDSPPGLPGWRVGVAGLNAEAPIEQWLVLHHQAVATSGDLWQFVEIDGRRYSHLIDPRSGVGLTESSSVTVVAPTGMQADAWASALSVMGPQSGFPVLGQLDSTEARVMRRVDQNQYQNQKVQLEETPGFARFYEPLKR